MKVLLIKKSVYTESGLHINFGVFMPLCFLIKSSFKAKDVTSFSIPYKQAEKEF